MPFKNIFKTGFGDDYLKMDKFSPIVPVVEDSLLNYISSDKLIAYYKSSDNHVSRSGTTVQYMEDLTGNGWTLGVGAGTVDWNSSDSNFNNNPSIQLDQADYLTSSFIPRNGGFGPYAQSGSCIGLVFKPGETANDLYFMIWGSNPGASKIHLVPWNSSGPRFRVDMKISGSFSTRAMDSGEQFSTTGSYAVVCQVKNGTSQTVQIYTNGQPGTTKVGAFSETISNKINDGKLFIGAPNPYEASFDAALTFVEAFVCKDTLTAQEHQDLLSYVENTYGIVSGSI